MRGAFAILLLFGSTALAQFGQFEIPGANTGPKANDFDDVGRITAEFTPRQAKPGQVVDLKLTVTPEAGWHTYPTAAKQDFLNKVKPEYSAPKPGKPGPNLIVVGPVKDPAGAEAVVKPGEPAYLEYRKPATWNLKVVVSPKATAGTIPFDWSGFAIQICKEQCFNARTKNFPQIALDVLPGSEPVPAEYEAEVKAALGETAAPPIAATPQAASKEESPGGRITKKHMPIEQYQAKLDAVLASLDKQTVKREGGITTLLLTAMFWGIVSLATPCVFPMIPITVSLFLKQSHQSATGAVKLAAVYSLTIIIVLGLSAITLLSVFYKLSVHPVTNVLLGGLFIVFALSLFGMYEIVLPNSLLRAAESRRKQGGMVGTVFGAIAFSIVSFTCVAPFLGGFAGMVSSGQYSQVELVLAGLSFATAFAAPFFVLALFPSLLKKLPKSGGWLDSVKVVMGFLEVAAALKFFRTAEIRWLGTPTYFTYDLVLAGWVVVSAACGLYLLNVYRLPHDEEKPNIGVPRLMIALMFLGLSVYLIPGLFKQPNGETERPRGIVFAWVDAFLLPEQSGAGDEFRWGVDLPGAIEKAREEAASTGMPKYVFVDFTGVTCSNCKANEREVFPKPQVAKLLKKYSLVQMYTDDVPAEFYSGSPDQRDLKDEGEANGNFQNAAFGTSQLPLYVILQPTATGAKVVGVYSEGKINNVEAFTQFLEAPLKK
jgi:thiol:disulfide interchange protein DsbD